MLTAYVARNSAVLALLSIASLLTACGGGGGGGDGGGGGGGNNPPPPPPVGTVQFSASSASVDETAGTANFTITRTGGSSGAVNVTVATSDGSATAGSDYTAFNQSVSFADGDTAAKTVTVSITDDSVAESEETLSLTLSAPTGGASLGEVPTVMLTIRDDDPAAGTVEFIDPNISFDESIGAMTVLIRRIGGSAGAVTVTVTSSNGSATAGSDYTALNTTVTFADGESGTKDVRVPILNDTENEANETLSLTLSAPTGGVRLGTNTTTTLTIRDNDPLVPQPGSLQFDSLSDSIVEGNAIQGVGITRTGGSTGAVSVTVTSSNGSATAGQDYMAVNTVVDFADGDTVRKSVQVQIRDDDQAEEDETLTLTLSAPTGGATLGTNRTFTVTIRDNELPPAGSVQFDPNSLSIDENAGTATLMVTLARTPGSTVPVSVTVVSSNGSATAGSDYTALNTSVTFADGDSAPKPVTVPILEDSDGEVDETLNVTLSAPTGGATLGMNERAAITILDNDPANAPVLTFGKGVKQLVFNWASVPGATRYRLFENLDGASGFTQIGPDHDATVTQARRDITAVYRFDWVNALYQLEACNARGCRSTTVGAVDAMVQAIGYFKASNTGFSDAFGCSVALSADGNTLAVGACQEGSAAQGVGGNQADNSASQAGAVYIFTRIAGQWSQQAYVKASNTQQGDKFGTAVALSENGNTLAVGVPLEDSAAVGVSGNPADQSDNGATDAGAVYIFTRSGVQWSQQAYVKASNTDAGDKFGTSIALNGDGSQLAVGAPGEASGVFNDETDNSRPGAGAVYMYTRADTQWSHSRYLKPLTIDSGDQFGFSIALSADGNTLAVGEPGEDSDSGTNQGNNASSNAGAVQVFDFTNPVPVPDYVKASNIGQADEFGFSVALSADGSTLAVGAHSEDSGAVGTGGNQNDNSAIDAGAAYVFIPVAGPFGIDWQQQAYVKASNTRASKRFGHSLALSADGNTLAVGSLFEASAATGVNGDQNDQSAPGAGAVYMLTRAAVWSQQSYVKASNTGEGDQFSSSLALSGDGNTLAVGAHFEDSDATGIDGNQNSETTTQAGAVYVY